MLLRVKADPAGQPPAQVDRAGGADEHEELPQFLPHPDARVRDERCGPDARYTSPPVEGAHFSVLQSACMVSKFAVAVGCC